MFVCREVSWIHEVDFDQIGLPRPSDDARSHRTFKHLRKQRDYVKSQGAPEFASMIVMFFVDWVVASVGIAQYLDGVWQDWQHDF